MQFSYTHTHIHTDVCVRQLLDAYVFSSPALLAMIRLPCVIFLFLMLFFPPARSLSFSLFRLRRSLFIESFLDSLPIEFAVNTTKSVFGFFHGGLRLH